ncbi:MAG: methyltransferase domain-containing protein [Candidatus Dormibacteraeota bacterium]|nr:methyltransferase domain-containing protein [Candidatus Dormibacteraeota bacterium]
MSEGLGHRAGSFGAAAAEYERGRPSYPAAAIDWLLPPRARRVLDLGAGTGKLTRQLVERGLEVVAVEPSPGMRSQLALMLPEVALLDGTAEAIPLPDHSVDAVLVAQAWHWVDPGRARPEVARVLTPGGRLGLVWNIRDEREDWVKQLGRTMHEDEDPRAPVPVVGWPFGRLQRHEVEWRYRATPAAISDLVASRSYVITLAPPQRDVLLADVRRLVETHPSLAGAEDIWIPYVTECYRADLLAT